MEHAKMRRLSAEARIVPDEYYAPKQKLYDAERRVLWVSMFFEENMIYFEIIALQFGLNLLSLE